MFPTAVVVKAKDAETKRNKASEAHSGWKKRTKTSTTTPKQVCLYSSSLQLLFQQKICKSASDRAAGKPHTPCDWASCVKERGLMRSSPTVLQSSLSFLSCFFFPCLFRRLQHTVDIFVAGGHQSLCFHFFPATKAIAGYTNTNGLFLVLSYALHLICFRVVLASFTLTTMAVGNTSEGFAFVLSPWSIWAHKNSSNGY